MNSKAKKKLKALLALIVTVTLVGGSLNLSALAENTAATPIPVGERQEYVVKGNPYLPLWEHTPDVEPYIFEDPDNSGKERVYVYGSHDTLKNAYCGRDLVVWSAPVDDLTKWRYDGVIFQNFTNGQPDMFYAPDVQLYTDTDGKKTYYLYPDNNEAGERRSMVCKSDRPDGPFEVINWADDTHTRTEGPLGFDPAVLIEGENVYAYWGAAFDYAGGEPGKPGSYWAKLDPENKATLKEGEVIHNNIPTRAQCDDPNFDPKQFNIVNDEHAKEWRFFEASSIRKVGNKYVFVYSHEGDWGNFANLAYGYSDSPEGPWKWGGPLVDAYGEGVNVGNYNYVRSMPSNNTHGSIIEINNDWYVFYHRCPGPFSRQATVEKIKVEYDDKPVSEGGEVRISQAEVTSQGFCTDGLDPYEKHSMGIASYVIDASIDTTYDTDAETVPISGIKDGSVVGIKYFNFDKNAPAGKSSTLELDLKQKGAKGTIDVYLRPTSIQFSSELGRDANGKIISVGEGSYKIASINLEEDVYKSFKKVRVAVPEVDKADGKWGLFFSCSSDTPDAEVCDFYNVKFTADDNPPKEPEFISLEPDSYNPYIRNEAEDFCDAYKAQTELSNEGGSQVGFIENGSRLMYKKLNFGYTGAEKFEISVASATNGGTIELHLDSADGPKIGTINVTNTGGWQNWVTKSCEVQNVKGLHDLYLTMSGGGGYLFNLNWWKFSKSENTSFLDTVSISKDNEKIFINSDYSDACDFDMYTALYNAKGELVRVKKNESSSVFDVNDDDKYTVKVFFWDGLKPVFDNITEVFNTNM